MATLKKKLSNLSKRSNRFYFLSLLILTLILIGGIQSAYAYYYNDADSLPILSNLVGDFDSGDGDVNIIIYKETGVKNGEFVKTYGVPQVGYSLNEKETSCKSPSNQVINCVKDNPNSDCNYTFNTDTKEINLTSNQKVTCRFYFNKDYENDIELYVMIQDENGTHEHAEKKYRNVDSIPAYGFTYIDYSCQKDSTVTIDPETGKIKVLSTQRDVCYAYYDGNLNNSDIIVNVYAQKVVGGNYVKINSIPVSSNYTLNAQSSICKKQDGVGTPSDIKPTYEGGFINLPETTEKLVCDAYLDITN